MPQARRGDTVRVHYTGTLDDGTVFDSSQGRDPLEFKLGEGMVIPGFETAVEGMEVGDKKTQRIPSENAYGVRREELMIEVPRAEVPPDAELEPGDQVQLQTSQGQVFVATVTEMTDEVVRLDANHQLAGHDLTFEIELAEVVGLIQL